ncbi:MAG: DDE-type integrase/transposase/recombinase [Pyrinomonadaceae bacterium]|nr:DDE-type integrase/transposase/recombinase [Pyrinomonadaceae bacterium]
MGSCVNITTHAVDKEGQTIEFLLSAKRDISAAKGFFKKIIRTVMHKNRRSSLLHCFRLPPDKERLATFRALK